MTKLVVFPTGDLLIIMAQVIVAIQMVLEEKFVYKHDVHPLQAVGTEGMPGKGAGLLFCFFGCLLHLLALKESYNENDWQWQLISTLINTATYFKNQ